MAKKMKRRDAAVRNQPSLFDKPAKKVVSTFNPIIKGIAYMVRTADGGTEWTMPKPENKKTWKTK